MRFTYQPGAQPLAGYTIRRGIRRGGFGEVYYAHSDGGKEVALKLLQHEQEVELRGVRQCLNIKHPNLVTLFDVRTDDHGEHWVIMEYVQGTSLEDVLQACPNGLPLDEVTEWLDGITAGVRHLHDRGIVHRDLKPANLYRENGIVKVGDVGLSKRLGSDRRGAHTQSVGTVYYMAPEVGHGQYGPEVDVYSLGIVLYELLTGQLPFDGETVSEVLMKHLTSAPDLSVLPEPLRPVLAHALAKDPRSRTASVDQLNEEYLSALSCMSESDRSRAVPTARTRARFETAAPEMATHLAATLPIPHSPARAASAYAEATPSRPVTPQPATPHAEPTPAADRKRPQRAERVAAPDLTPAHINWQFLLFLVVGLLLFSSGTWRAWTGIVLAAGTIVTTAWLRGRDGEKMSSQALPEVRGGRSNDHVRGDLATTLSVGGAAAALGSVATVYAAEFVHRSPVPPSSELMTLVAATSLAATWLILIAGHLRRRSSFVLHHPRTTLLLLGTLVGSAAYGLNQVLILEPSSVLSSSSALFHSLGIHPLIHGDRSPTWLGYIVFFGGLMLWYHWWHDISPQRTRQMSFGRLGTAAFCAWLLTCLFAFPQGLALMWAVSISAAVQLATPWSPSRRTLRS